MAAAARAAVSNATHQEVKMRTDEELMAELQLEQTKRAEEDRVAAAERAQNPYLVLADFCKLFTVGKYSEKFGLSIMVRARVVASSPSCPLQLWSCRLPPCPPPSDPAGIRAARGKYRATATAVRASRMFPRRARRHRRSHRSRFLSLARVVRRPRAARSAGARSFASSSRAVSSACRRTSPRTRPTRSSS